MFYLFNVTEKNQQPSIRADPRLLGVCVNRWDGEEWGGGGGARGKRSRNSDFSAARYAFNTFYFRLE